MNLRLRERWTSLVAWCDREHVLLDVHVYGGVALAAWGGWQLSPAWTGIGVGCIFVILGLVPVLRRRKGAE